MQWILNITRHPKSAELMAWDAENQQDMQSQVRCQSACAHKLTNNFDCLYKDGYLPPCGLIHPTGNLSSSFSSSSWQGKNGSACQKESSKNCMVSCAVTSRPHLKRLSHTDPQDTN